MRCTTRGEIKGDIGNETSRDVTLGLMEACLAVGTRIFKSGWAAEELKGEAVRTLVAL
jgi:hypothetical protein